MRNNDGSVDYDSMNHDYFLLLYADMWLYTAAMRLSKMTALVLYWRLFGKSATRSCILLLVGCVVWWSFARVSMDLPCIGVQGLMIFSSSSFWSCANRHALLGPEGAGSLPRERGPVFLQYYR
jgi:hypothetical protein